MTYVTPIQLLSFAEAQNPVLVLDYRLNREEVFNYPDEELIYVSHVPKFVLKPGCSFSMLLAAYPKNERSILYKIGCYELVALVGSQNPPVTSGGGLNPTSPAAILYGAITKLNKISPPKRDPVFLINGFRGWKSTFPIYTRPSLGMNSNAYRLGPELYKIMEAPSIASEPKKPKKKKHKKKKKVKISPPASFPIQRPPPFIEAWPNISSMISKLSLENMSEFENEVQGPSQRPISQKRPSLTSSTPVVTIRSDKTYVQLSNYNLAGDAAAQQDPETSQNQEDKNAYRFYDVKEWMSSASSNSDELEVKMEPLECEEVETLEDKGCKITKIVENVYELVIPEGATGIGYEEIFSMCVDGNLTEVLVEDPFIDTPHQPHDFVQWQFFWKMLRNFAMFCGFLVEKSPNLRKIRLFTKKGTNYGKLTIIKNSLQKRRIELNIVYMNFHDREFRFSNGWRVRIGRGLDIYQWTSEYDIDYHRLDRRTCKNTTVIYIKLN